MSVLVSLAVFGSLLFGGMAIVVIVLRSALNPIEEQLSRIATELRLRNMLEADEPVTVPRAR